MPYKPGGIPVNPDQLPAYLARELDRIAFEINQPNPESMRLQRFEPTPAKPRDGDIFYFPAVGGFDPGSGFGIYWFDGQRYRLIAGLDEVGLLGGFADDVTVLDAPAFTTVVNFDRFAESPGMTVDQVAGTITLPAIPGAVSVIMFLHVNQITAFKDFSLILYLAVGGVPVNASGSAYNPQQSSDIDLFVTSVYTRPVAGGEVLSMQLQIDGATTSDFQILDSTFEIRYAADLSIGGASTGNFIAGQLP